MKLAIVGSRKLAGSEEARSLIHAEIVSHLRDDSKLWVISGGAVGVDAMAAEEGSRLGATVVNYLPEKPSMYYYRKRNQEIADACDKLICLTSKSSRTRGGAWTLARAAEQGKPTKEYLLP